MLYHGLFRLFQVNPRSNAELTQSSLRWPSGLPGLYPTLNCIFITQHWHRVLWYNLIYLTGYRKFFKMILGKQAGLLQGHEMAGWHHRLDGHEFGDGQRGLECCDSWGCKESDTTERQSVGYKEFNKVRFLYCWTSEPLLSNGHDDSEIEWRFVVTANFPGNTCKHLLEALVSWSTIWKMLLSSII